MRSLFQRQVYLNIYLFLIINSVLLDLTTFQKEYKVVKKCLKLFVNS